MSKQIPLTQGRFALVDDEDYEFLMQWKWHFDGKYARRVDRTGTRVKIVYMHRVINKTPDGYETDHINGDKLYNKKENLRNATKSENLMNRKSFKGSTSKYKGVYLCGKKWRACIQIDGKTLHLGSFSDDISAAIAYNKAATERFGEFAKLNEV